MASHFMPTSNLFIVDDDPTMRDVLSVMFTLAGYRVHAFADAAAFMAMAREAVPAGVLLDLHLPDKSGLDVLKDIDAPRYPAPVFMITADNDIAYAVEAVKNGAFDYLLKPFDSRAIVTRVGNAIALFAKRNAQARATPGIVFEFAGQSLLRPREREVLALVAAGASNKEAGRRLGISPRTVEVHRACIMEKIGARNAADLVRIVLSGNGKRPSQPQSEMVA